MHDHLIIWDRGDFSISPVGAMCAPAHFRLDDGRVIQPFAVAPPLAAQGIRTSVAFRAGQTWSTSYSIEISAS